MKKKFAYQVGNNKREGLEVVLLLFTLLVTEFPA